MKAEGVKLIPERIRPFFRRFHLAGSILGLILFIRFGLKVGIEFGLVGGRLLADDLIPDDIKFSALQLFITSVGTVLGVFLGVACTLSFFLVIGAITGDLTGRFIKVFFLRDKVDDV